MNIGFDLDKILVDQPPFIPARMIERLNKEKNHPQLLYRFPSKPEQFIRRLSHYSLLRPTIKKNLAFIRNLADKNTNKHYLISGRFGFLEKATLSLAKKQQFDTIFDAMFFNFADEQPHVFKNKVIQQLQLDKYIDDDLDLLEYLAKYNENTTFFWLNPRFYEQLQPNLFAITHLKYIL